MLPSHKINEIARFATALGWRNEVTSMRVDKLEQGLNDANTQITFERERSVAAEGRAQRLEEQLAAVTQQLLDAQAKTIAQLQAQ